MKTTKPIARLIEAQIQSLDDEEQTAQEAAKAATARRAKQKDQLSQILNAVECDGLDANAIRLRALTEPKQQ